MQLKRDQPPAKHGLRTGPDRVLRFFLSPEMRDHRGSPRSFCSFPSPETLVRAGPLQLKSSPWIVRAGGIGIDIDIFDAALRLGVSRAAVPGAVSQAHIAHL
jgi:hypothetical protein